MGAPALMDIGALCFFADRMDPFILKQIFQVIIIFIRIQPDPKPFRFPTDFLVRFHFLLLLKAFETGCMTEPFGDRLKRQPRLVSRQAAHTGRSLFQRKISALLRRRTILLSTVKGLPGQWEHPAKRKTAGPLPFMTNILLYHFLYNIRCIVRLLSSLSEK